jgi:hypothetical protein
MPATPITPAIRYYRAGVTRVYFCSTIANKSAPTRAELNAGTDLSGDVAAINGWEPTSNFENAPDLLSTFVSKVASSVEVGDSSLGMYASSNSVDARGLFPRGTTGFVVMLDEGDANPKKMDVFPVTVASAPKQRDIGAVAQIVVSFAITSAPAENVTIPA